MIVVDTRWDWYKVWMLVLSALILAGNLVNVLHILGVL